MKWERKLSPAASMILILGMVIGAVALYTPGPLPLVLDIYIGISGTYFLIIPFISSILLISVTLLIATAKALYSWVFNKHVEYKIAMYREFIMAAVITPYMIFYHIYYSIDSGISRIFCRSKNDPNNHHNSISCICYKDSQRSYGIQKTSRPKTNEGEEQFFDRREMRRREWC
jgi:hypothetical protein